MSSADECYDEYEQIAERAATRLLATVKVQMVSMTSFYLKVNDQELQRLIFAEFIMGPYPHFTIQGAL